jgi:hypothetical protein
MTGDWVHKIEVRDRLDGSAAGPVIAQIGSETSVAYQNARGFVISGASDRVGRGTRREEKERK